MRQPLHVAIVGAGTAGLSTALFLARQGHHVELFEQSHALESVGAGLLLQPSGLAAVRRLGLLPRLTSLAQAIEGLIGCNRAGERIVDAHYRDARLEGGNEWLIGQGVHRASLCKVLLEGLADPAIPPVMVHLGHAIDHIDNQPAYSVVHWQYDEQRYELAVDLVVVANGARSQLRPRHWVELDEAYPWGALWATVAWREVADPRILHQRYAGTQVMASVLPIGSLPDQDTRLASLFWSIPQPHSRDLGCTQHDCAYLREQWQSHWPEMTPLIEQITHPKQLQVAGYRDVWLRQFAARRVVVIGDAAHAMSPQLGQGVNMALLDACALAQALAHHETWTAVWKHYHQQRLGSIRFYQRMSRVLTPLFQSDRVHLGPWRDRWMRRLHQVPVVRTQMAQTISGVKTGMLSHHNLAGIREI